MDRLTPWFPGDVKPARRGVYWVLYYGSPVYAKWDGRAWYRGHVARIGAAANEHDQADFEPEKWRGLAKEPK